KGVAIEADRHVGLGNDALGADDVGIARGMDREHDHHRRRLHRRVGNLETDPDLHPQTSAAVPPACLTQGTLVWVFWRHALVQPPHASSTMAGLASSPTEITLILTSISMNSSVEPR